MFPTTSQILNNYLVTMSVSLFALVLVAVFAIWQIRSAGKDAIGGKSDLRPKLFAAAGLLLWIAGAYFFNWPIFTALKHRINPEQIVELRVKQLGDSQKAPIVISDRALIAAGLKTLANAPGYSMVQERFMPDGYEIELKSEGAAEYLPVRLMAYRQSRRPPSGAVPVSIVAVSAQPGAAEMNFSSPSFHSWLRRNVDPLFVTPLPEYLR